MDVVTVGDVPRAETLAATAQAGSSAPTATPEQTNSQPSKQVGLVDMLAHYHEYFQKLQLDMQHTTQAIMQRRGRSGSKAKVRADAHDPRGFDAIAQGVKSRDKPLVRIVGKDDVAGASEPAADGSRALRDEDLVLIRSQLRAAALAEAQSEALSSQLSLGMGASPRLMGASSSSSMGGLPPLPPVDLQQELEIMEAEEFLITADELPEAFGATDVGMLTGLVQEATAGLDLEPFAAALGVGEPFASVLGDDDEPLAPLTAVPSLPLTSASVAAMGGSAAPPAAAPLPPIPTVPPTPPSHAVAVASVATTPSDEATPAADAAAEAGSSEPAPSSQQQPCAAEAQDDDAALMDACFVAHEAAPPSPTRTPSPASAPDSPPASPAAKRVGSARREGDADADAAVEVAVAGGEEGDVRSMVVEDGGDEASSEAGSDRTSATAEVGADVDVDAEPSPPTPSPIEQSLTGKRRAAAAQRQLETDSTAAVEVLETEPAGKRRRRGPPTSAASN